MQFTRERILSILKERGQATVDELSRELGLTAVTVRHHLEILRGEGLVAAPVIRRHKMPGRPQYVYTLAEKASAFFPKRYEHLAGLILSEARARLSPAEVAQMMQRIGERVASQADLPDGDDFATRLTAATEFLNGLGYMAHWENGKDGDYLLHVANCPYEQVSQQDDVICTIDFTLLTRLLGATPQRAAWAAHGEPHCVYIICPSGA